jgi:hypothetical protein
MRTQAASTVAEIVIRKMAHELMGHYNLSQTGWEFYFNDNRSRLGVCKDYNKSIELSVWHVNNSPFESVKNTLLHEIAHAIVGCGHQHNHVWRRKAIEIGCDGERCGTMNAPYKYTAICSNCETTYQTNRASNKACGRCCKKFNSGRYSSEYKFIFNRN